MKMGEQAVPYLVKSLVEPANNARGLAAMALIRIGDSSVKYLEGIADESPEFKWIADYIIDEIRGTQVQLSPVALLNNKLEEVLVG